MHRRYVDEEGNVQLFGLSGDTIDGALASRRIVASVEGSSARQFARGRIDRSAGLPASPRCARSRSAPDPAYVEGFYGRDDAAYVEWDRLGALARAPLGLARRRDPRAFPTFAEYVARLEPARVAALKAARGRNLASAA